MQQPNVEIMITVLKSARDLINNGWIQHEVSCYDNKAKTMRYCAIGALYKVLCNTEHSLDMPTIIHELEKDRAITHTTVTGFNDAPGRTQSDVLGFFDRTIERLERSYRAAV